MRLNRRDSEDYDDGQILGSVTYDIYFKRCINAIFKTKLGILKAFHRQHYLSLYYYLDFLISSTSLEIFSTISNRITH